MENALLFGAIFAFVGIALGAFGAHALKAKFRTEHYANVWDKGCRYFMYNAFALVGVGILQRVANDDLLNTAALLFVLGGLLFSVSLWVLSLVTKKWVGAITPIGGVLQLAGWICVILYAMN